MSKKLSTHDKKVSNIAGGYKSLGYKVQADLPGQPKPQTIGGRRPDVIAKKGREIKVVGGETPKSAQQAHARAQKKAFRAWAAGGQNRSFRTAKTKK